MNLQLMRVRMSDTGAGGGVATLAPPPAASAPAAPAAPPSTGNGGGSGEGGGNYGPPPTPASALDGGDAGTGPDPISQRMAQLFGGATIPPRHQPQPAAPFNDAFTPPPVSSPAGNLGGGTTAGAAPANGVPAPASNAAPAAPNAATANQAPADPRVQELEQRLAALEPYSWVVDNIRNQFPDADAARQAYEAQQTQARENAQRQREESFVNDRMQQIQSTLTDRYQQKVNAGVLTVETANEELSYALSRERETLNREIAADRTAQNHKTETAQRQITAAVQQYPSLRVGASADGKVAGIGENIVRALHVSGYGDVPQIARYIDALIQQNVQMAVADHAAHQTRTQAATTPAPLTGGGGAIAPAATPLGNGATAAGAQNPLAAGVDWARQIASTTWQELLGLG